MADSFGIRFDRRAAVGLILVLAGSLRAPGQTARLPDTPAAAPTPPREQTFALQLQPKFTVPVGPSAGIFTPGGAVSLGAEYGFGGTMEPFVAAGIDYTYAPIQAETAVSILSAEAGGGLCLWLNQRLGLRLGGAVGYYYGWLMDGGGASGHVTGQLGVGLQYVLFPEMNLGLSASYRYDLGLYQGLEIVAGASYFLSGRERRLRGIEELRASRRPQQLEAKTPQKGRGIELANVSLYEIFPVFHKFYDDHPVGVATLINKEKVPITDIKLTFFVKQYMDSAKECPAPSELPAGGRQDVDIMSLLTDRVLEVTEATKVAADLTLEYRMGGDLYRDSRTLTIRILDRNSMTWDDDRKAAAFVTAKDPVVMVFSKGVIGITRDKAPAILNANLATAMSLFSTLDRYGLSYVVDPKSSYAELSKSGTTIDYLQFPRLTLEAKAGDCDDLSILYAALLESVGVETAFVTVPGHIYLAFSTGLKAEEAQRSFSTMTELIVKKDAAMNDVAWVPVEVTERRGGFMKAWVEGAREWREAEAQGSAGFIPIRSAWNEYEPVQLPGSSELSLPGDDAIVSAFLQEVTKFVDREIAPRISQMEQDIKRTGGTPAAYNKLGVLYAQYGKLDQAEAAFRLAIGKQNYLPGLLNLGNLYSLKNDWTRAQEQYELAARLEPQNPAVLLALARAYYASEHYDLARAKHQELAKVDRNLAERYAYLGGTGEAGGDRAGEAASRLRQIEWTE